VGTVWSGTLTGRLASCAATNPMRAGRRGGCRRGHPNSGDICQTEEGAGRKRIHPFTLPKTARHR
jgi:hypothetical protein